MAAKIYLPIVEPTDEDSVIGGTSADGQRFYVPQLDGLRFLAALLVFFYHAPQLAGLGLLHRIGWVGVDLFFAISAFLITRLLMIEHQRTGRIMLKYFFVRRALRIWPLYFGYALAIAGATLIATRFAPEFVTTKISPTYVMAWTASHFGFVNNLMTARLGYSLMPLSNHLWTISLEEQAYLVLPVALGLILAAAPARRSIVRVTAILALVLILARLPFVLMQVPHPFVWTLPLRADAFLFGACAALCPMRPMPWLAVIGAALMASVALLPDAGAAGLHQLLIYTFTASACTAVVIGVQGDTLISRLLGIAPLRYLGRISYGFYVFHIFAIYLAEKLLQRVGSVQPTMIFALALPLTIGIAALSYQLYERPFLKAKDRFAVVKSRAA